MLTSLKTLFYCDAKEMPDPSDQSMETIFNGKPSDQMEHLITTAHDAIGCPTFSSMNNLRSLVCRFPNTWEEFDTFIDSIPLGMEWLDMVPDNESVDPVKACSSVYLRFY